MKKEITVYESGPELLVLEWAAPILEMLSDSGKGAKDNFEDNYFFFTGWTESKGGEGEFSVDKDGVYHSQYEEDRPLKPLVRVDFGEEVVYIYDYAITVIVQPDGSMLQTRID